MSLASAARAIRLIDGKEDTIRSRRLDDAASRAIPREEF